MRDGLYQVTRGPVTAGFVVENGRVTLQAPILRARGMGGEVRRVDTFYRVMVTGSRDYAAPPRIVHLKRDQYDIRIDRSSKWGNPFRIGQDGSRDEVIQQYEQWLTQQPELVADLNELRGKTLGCWCVPNSCHGDVLAKYVAEADRAQVRRDLTATLAKFGCRPDQVVVVNGKARGLDTHARDAAVELGMRVEDHPVTSADWERHGKSAGHRRNAVMVASTSRRPAVGRGVIAYPVGESRGTRGAMAMCENTPELKGKVWNRTDPSPAASATGSQPTAVEISEFRGRHRFLSSYDRRPVVYDGIRYPSREHAFHAAKTFDTDLRLKIAATGSPAEAKRLGQEVPLREDWDSVRVGVMTELIRAQVGEDTDLADRLLATGDADLREGNTWHDQIWGDCRCGRDACAGPGQNHLGKSWMRVRDELRQTSDPAGPASRLGER